MHAFSDDAASDDLGLDELFSCNGPPTILRPPPVPAHRRQQWDSDDEMDCGVGVLDGRPHNVSNVGVLDGRPSRADWWSDADDEVALIDVDSDDAVSSAGVASGTCILPPPSGPRGCGVGHGRGRAGRSKGRPRGSVEMRRLLVAKEAESSSHLDKVWEGRRKHLQSLKEDQDSRDVLEKLDTILAESVTGGETDTCLALVLSNATARSVGGKETSKTDETRVVKHILVDKKFGMTSVAEAEFLGVSRKYFTQTSHRAWV